jgi:hypothetical protein
LWLDVAALHESAEPNSDLGLHAYGFDHGRRPCSVSRPNGLSQASYRATRDGSAIDYV